MNAKKHLLPRTARPDPYIENGGFGYVYTDGRFRKIKSDHHTGGGSFQFNYCDNNQVGCCGWQWVYLFSPEDMQWLKEAVAKFGTDLILQLNKAAQTDSAAAHLVSWLESANLEIQLRAARDSERNVRIHEFALDPDRFLRAALDAEI